jgi:hypothetical protein
MARMSLPVWILIVSTFTACGEKIDRCLEPVDGSRADVTLAFEDASGFTVAECTTPSSNYAGAFRVQGTVSQRLFADRDPGDFSLASDFQSLVVSSAVKDVPSFHQGNVTHLWTDCENAAPRDHYAPVVFLSDWADVDQGIEKLGQALKEEALGETVIVAVQQVFCED